jgi:hypothetical protein
MSLGNTFLRLFEEIVYGRQIARTEITDPPLFILGHWRCGTTLLHELLALDARHTAPTTYECFVPNHFLLTQRLLASRLGFLLPRTRPMDNIPLGFRRPYEDEYALCNMGRPSLYLNIAFPNAPQYTEYLDLDEVSPQERERWKKSYVHFLKRITLSRPKRLVLKNPAHTCRLKTLLELFPEARFVHIVRNPYDVFPSMVHLLKTMFRVYALERPHFERVEEYVFDLLSHLYNRFEEDRHVLDPSRFHELRYEDLVQDPIGNLRGIYNGLELGEFEEVLPQFRQYLAGIAGYRTNRYVVTPELRAEIAGRLGWVVRRYGYDGKAEPSRPTERQQLRM